MHHHDTESQGSKPRDHQHIRHHIVRHVSTNWRFYAAVMLMLALVLAYDFTMDLSFLPGKGAGPRQPAANMP